jgi:hypothetical protein
VPASSLTTTPVLALTTTASTIIGQSFNLTINSAGNAVIAETPAYSMHASVVPPSTNIQIYGLNLTTSTQPIGQPIGTFSVPLPVSGLISDVICDSTSSQTNFLDPSTLFVVLQVANTPPCSSGTSTYTYYVVNYADTGAPTTVTIPTPPSTVGLSSNIESLYAPTGALAQIAIYDPVNQVLDVYPYTSGTALTSTPTSAITGLNSATFLDDSVNTQHGTTAFYDVTLAASSSTHVLYRLPYSSATATAQYTAAGTFGQVKHDTTNLYFTDNSGSTTTSQNVVQAPVAGGAAVQLLSPANTYTASTGVSLSVFGSNGSLLVVKGAVEPLSSSPATTNYYSLNIGSAQALPARTYFASGLFVEDQLVATTPGDITTRVLLVNVVTELSSGGGISYTQACFAGTPAGNTRQALQGTAASGSQFILSSGDLTGQPLQVNGITDANGQTQGGGTVSVVNLSGSIPGLTTLNAVGGGAYVVGAGTALEVGDLTSALSVGFIVGSANSAAVNLASDVVVPISLTNTTLTPDF